MSSYHHRINVRLMVTNIIQIKSGISMSVDVRATIQENIMFVKNIILRILVHVLVKIENI